MAETNEIGSDNALVKDACVEPDPAVQDAEALADGIKITVAADGEDSLVVDLRGLLDDATGQLLLEVLNRGVVDGVRRVAIDLCNVDGVTEEGAHALAECRDVGRRFSDGLHYRSDSGPGREALMAALADLSADDDLA